MKEKSEEIDQNLRKLVMHEHSKGICINLLCICDIAFVVY